MQPESEFAASIHDLNCVFEENAGLCKSSLSTSLQKGAYHTPKNSELEEDGILATLLATQAAQRDPSHSSRASKHGHHRADLPNRREQVVLRDNLSATESIAPAGFSACHSEDNVGSGRYSISLQQHVPVKPVAERRLQFTVDSSMLDELVATFGLDQLRKDIPPECQLHPAAGQLLQSSAGLQPQDKVANLVVFVDGSFVAKHGACAWSFAAFESRPTALIWLGYMAGVVPDQACGGKPSAFRAEIFAQLMAHLFGVAQESRRITFVHDATSAAMVAAGDCAIEDDDAVARKLVAAGVLARSMGKTLRQVHTKSHSGNPGNELVDSLASHAAYCYVDLQAPTSCYSWLLDEQIIDWLWLVPQSHDDPRLPPLAEDGAFVAQTITSDAAGRQAPVAFRPGQGGACLQPNFSANVKARFRLMTYNALSLRSCGQGHALTHEMRRLGVHVLALQECREEVEKIRFQNGICKLAGPAQGGHFGCQIWIDCEKPVGQLEDGVPVAWNKKSVCHTAQ